MSQLLKSKYIKRWLLMAVIGSFIVTFFATLEKQVDASVDIQFNKTEHAGKFVALGGRNWVVIDVIDEKPYLMMDSMYAKKSWNSSGDSSDASEIFQYLKDEFNSIITVAADRDLIAETTWEIRSMSFGNVHQEYTTAGSKAINPSSFTQKLGLISNMEMDNYCTQIAQVLSGNDIWTRTPVYDEDKLVYYIWSNGSGCVGGPESPNNSNSGIQPVLYLKESVRIKGGLGTKADPYVLSVSAAPEATHIEADGTTNTVTVTNVPAHTTVKVYGSNQTTVIGSKTNGGSTGTVTVSVTDISWNETIYVTFTERSKGESNKVATTVKDDAPPDITLSASPTSLTNTKVTVTAAITDKGSAIAEKKWAQGKKDVSYFSSSGQNINESTFEVNENAVYTVYAKDAAGNVAVKEMTINNIDRTPPTLLNVTIQSSNGQTSWAKVGDMITLTFTASETLALGASSQATIANNVVSIENTSGLDYRATYTMQDIDQEGKITFSINYRDHAGNLGDSVTSTNDNSQVQFDKTAPTIDFSQNGSTTPAKTVATTVTVSDSGGVGENTLQYVWTNSESKPEHGWQSFNNGEQLKLEDENANGNWYLHVRAEDVAGNQSYASSNAFVLDHIAPQLTFIGDASLTIEAGSTFTDPGATAHDDIDGDLTASIVTTGVVDTSAEGTYTLTYTVTDTAGNQASIERTVIVKQAEPPVIQFAPNGNPTSAKQAQSKVVVTDSLSGVAENSLQYVWTNSPNKPSSGWQPFNNGEQLKLEDENANGNWYLHVRAEDKAGNKGYQVSEAFVLDNKAPIITLTGDHPMIVEAGSTFVDPGAIAIDEQDGDLTEHIVVTGTIDPMILDEYELSYDVKDFAGNEALTVTRTVKVQDNQPPILELLGEEEITLPYGATFEDPGAKAIDSFYGDVSHLIEVLGSVDPMSPGTYTLRYQVEDPSGNRAQEQVRMVHVRAIPSSPSTPSGSDENSSQLFIDFNGALVDVATFDLSQSIVTLKVGQDDGERTAYVTVPVSILTTFADKNKSLQLEIQAPYGSYLLPAALPSLILEWEELLKDNDWQAEQMGVKLTLVDKTEDETIQTALMEQFSSSRVISTVVDVHLVVVDTKTGEELTELKQFTEPLIRLLPLREELDTESNLWGAFRYDEASGEFQFVPARLERRDGQSFAVIRSYSNSIYLVAENHVSFSDTRNHWAKADVAHAAAKGLVRGIGDGNYAPDRPVTRAEFATMLVRAIGQSNDPINSLPFKDVQREAWYANAVAKAKELGLFDFIEGDRLFPRQPLTREEMASMLAAVIRLEKQSLPEKLASLDHYNDKGQIDESYLEDIELIVTLEIMIGTGVEQFSPKGETTRAQAAVVLLRAASKLGWID